MQAVALPPRPDTARAAWAFRRRSLANLLRMGHCAPTVMQTLLDLSHKDNPSLVKLAAGLPGGIGNSGGECGGLTAPLVFLGLQHADEAGADGVPIVVLKGRELLRRFVACLGTTSCRVIRGDARVPLRCIDVMCRAPMMGARVMHGEGAGSTTPEDRGAFALLFAHWRQRQFHCAHCVLRSISAAAGSEQLLAATSGFVGGTACSGMTCSALTAGVMALGSSLGTIENSRLRVLRMIGLMALKRDAFAISVNAFNATMNLGHRLAQRFEARFGTTQCRDITQVEFCSTAGVRNYIDSDGVVRCGEIARWVAAEVRKTLEVTGGVDKPTSPTGLQQAADG